MPATGEHDVWVFDDFELDLGAWRLTRAGRPVQLEPKALAVLAFLVARPGQAVTKADILDEVWKNTSVTENAMVRIIAHLRAALDDDSNEPKYIETVHTRGYRFIAAVRRAATPATDSSRPARSSWRSPARRLGMGALAALLVLAGWLVTHRSWSSQAAAVDDAPSIAILPLENLGTPDQQYFADGMTDALTTQLAGIGALKVIAHSAVRQYGASRPAPSVVARELSVGHLVEGSALLADGRVRINARLVDARTNQTLWAESFEEDMRDVLTLQSRVAREIVAGIRARVTPDEHQRLSRARTVAPEAYQEYLQGLFEAERVFAMDAEMFRHVREAIRRLSAAAAMEPQWAEAQGALAMAHLRLAGLSDNHAERLKEYASAQSIADRALALDPTVVSAHLVLARTSLFVDGDWAATDRQYRELFRLEPNNSDYSYGVFLSLAGRFDESLDRLRYALERTPTSPYVRYSLGVACICANRVDDALAEARALRERLGDDVQATLIEAMADIRRQRFADAIARLEAKRAAIAVNRATTMNEIVAFAAARFGQEQRARDALRDIVSLGGKLPAHVVFELDGPEAAVTMLRESAERHEYTILSARCWPNYEQMRKVAEVSDIFRKLGISDTR
jgi:TolB-like protein/DNA-binding winged helix-turn-helix (wHTH) protein/Tfp pilus assembly protein PilF